MDTHAVCVGTGPATDSRRESAGARIAGIVGISGLTMPSHRPESRVAGRRVLPLTFREGSLGAPRLIATDGDGVDVPRMQSMSRVTVVAGCASSRGDNVIRAEHTSEGKEAGP